MTRKLELPIPLTALLDHLTAAVMLIDEDGAICGCNLAAESLFDCSQRRLIGLRFEQLFDYCSFPEENISRCISDEQSFSDGEVTVILPDQTKHVLDVMLSAISWESCTYALIECRAIENQKRLSHETLQLQQQSAARELVRGLAHEIKNPLGGLRGAAQLLDKELRDPGLQEFTNMIIEQADRLRNLVDRLLGPNRLPASTTQNIHVIIEKVRQLVELDKPAAIEIIRDYDPSLPNINVDSDQIQQAVLNIVGNAVQAVGDSGTITLRTRIGGQQTIHAKNYKQTLEIKVIDSGPGISEKLKDTLFYPMVTDKANGTGLGLSIAQTLINQHGGKIDCESRPGCTEFTIFLPLNMDKS